jgi:hypothetical protein
MKIASPWTSRSRRLKTYMTKRVMRLPRILRHPSAVIGDRPKHLRATNSVADLRRYSMNGVEE